MLKIFKRIFCGKSKVKYSSQQISEALDTLIYKIAKIGLSAEIISPYFNGEKINGKTFWINTETTPLVIILQDAIRYHYGQLGRSYFDTQGREKNTASLAVLKEQIFGNDAAGKQRQKIYKTEFNDINRKLGKAQKYKKKLNKYCNKHFAHNDINSLEQSEKDLIALSIPWKEFIELVDGAKKILRDMCVAYEKAAPDFSESAYQDFKNQFWNLINFTEMKVANHNVIFKKDSE